MTTEDLPRPTLLSSPLTHGKRQGCNRTKTTLSINIHSILEFPTQLICLFVCFKGCIEPLLDELNPYDMRN